MRRNRLSRECVIQEERTICIIRLQNLNAPVFSAQCRSDNLSFRDKFEENWQRFSKSYKFHSVVQYKFSVRTGNVSDCNVFCLSYKTCRTFEEHQHFFWHQGKQRSNELSREISSLVVWRISSSTARNLPAIMATSLKMARISFLLTTLILINLFGT